MGPRYSSKGSRSLAFPPSHTCGAEEHRAQLNCGCRRTRSPVHSSVPMSPSTRLVPLLGSSSGEYPDGGWLQRGSAPAEVFLTLVGFECSSLHGSRALSTRSTWSTQLRGAAALLTQAHPHPAAVWQGKESLAGPKTLCGAKLGRVALVQKYHTAAVRGRCDGSEAAMKR